MQTINRKLIKQYIEERGPGAKEELAYKVKCSFSLIDKMIYEKDRKAPKPYTQIEMSREMGIPRSILFPEVKETSPKLKSKTAKRVINS